MISDFRDKVASALGTEAGLADFLGGMTAADWQPLAELFAARLPEFDAVCALPGGEELAAQVARIRGVEQLPAGHFPAGNGEVALFAAQLRGGEDAQEAAAQAQAAGWGVSLLATAVEYTTGGGRAQLSELGVLVRAVAQLAETPAGLVFERRSPDRWTG